MTFTDEVLEIAADEENVERSWTETAADSPWRNPTQLERPSFLLNFPFSFSTRFANNAWMDDLPPEQRRPDFKRASLQFLELYRCISAEALVYLLPSAPAAQLQDLVYTANLGVVLEHLPERDTVVISNFSSPPRRGETAVGTKFFEEMGYRVHLPPTKFEGEAELKHLYDGLYAGGYGIRSERETYDWMQERFDMRVIPLRLTDPYLYHLDCMVFPITREDTLVCTGLLEDPEIAALEKVTNIIEVSVDDCYSGICNSVRMPKTVLNASNLHDLKAGTEDYRYEVQKNRRLEDIASNLALEVCYINLGEFQKSGALLSCMVMHLNRHAYKFALTA